MLFLGTRKLQVRSRTNVKGVLQSNSGRQGHGTIVEEINLQSDLEARWLGAWLLQKPEFSRATRVNSWPGAALLLRVVNPVSKSNNKRERDRQKKQTRKTQNVKSEPNRRLNLFCTNGENKWHRELSVSEVRRWRGLDVLRERTRYP